MRRILFPIIILIILFTSSCTIQTSNSNASNSPTESSQLIFAFDNNNFKGHSDLKETDEKLQGTICLSPTLEEKQKKSLINEYLQRLGTYKETPDSVTYDNGRLLVEHYLNETKEKTSFIFHLYGKKSESENAIASQDAIICTTINLSDFQKVGYLSYTFDEQQRTNHESLLDTKKNPIAAINYQYLNGVPFPFITKYEASDTSRNIADHVLNINQKFWIYKDNAEFDNAGKWTGYSADMYKNHNSGYTFTCSYDTKGNLVKIIGETDKSDLLNEINLVYQKAGLLSTVDYTRPDTVYGTADSSGQIHYDENGRMIYKENYITHGTQYVFYLYNDEDKRPWICIQLDSAIQGHITDEVDYGNQVTAYLFQSFN
ncbi:hypothetical protein [Sinanaerobacter sp. ZZT-01]|uniref:hypothetical protein n=1 Tax=Sinanaerobacter sp. ZZT-01 TaxID=3111540 RepID=UPI002D7947A3|nr:hypothetical protein [Sinanaerobacter sp. ZZT-01]WRR93005.1 hypothetical protein U5921_13330 [Sinanaerobacter sp. ZZT-01]